VTVVGRVVSTREGAMKSVKGRDYKSKATLFGMPMVHIATGIDPATGKKRVARGIVAIGNIAVGMIALGGVAMGGVTLGGVAVGIVSLGGLSVGITLAIGAVALGSGLTLGGFAAGAMAIGGMAVGYYSIGGGAVGIHALSNMDVDPEAKKLLTPWAIEEASWRAMLFIFCPTASLILVFMALLSYWIRLCEPRSALESIPTSPEIGGAK
jgi:hypothetical protein